jgi:glycyl-tRNA synthetase
MIMQVLAEEIPVLLVNLSFPKTMRWNSQVSYSRPLRWFLALHGDTIVPFTYAGILSGRSSRVLRNSLQPAIQVAKAEDYLEATKEAGLIICMKERKESIWVQSSELAARINGQIPEESKGG